MFFASFSPRVILHNIHDNKGLNEYHGILFAPITIFLWDFAVPSALAQAGNFVANILKSNAYYSIDVPSVTTRLVATLDVTPPPTGTNDCDLFAKFANFPTSTLFNAKGVENKTNEILTVSNPAAGTWYFRPCEFTGYSDVIATKFSVELSVGAKTINALTSAFVK